MNTTKNLSKNKKEVIIIGRINIGKQPIGGETAKNQNLIKGLEQYCLIYPLDFYQNNQHPWVFFQTIWTLLFHPNATLILSSTASNVYLIMKIHKWIKSKRNVIHLCVGGKFADYVLAGKYSPLVLNSLKANLVQSESMNQKLKLSGVTNSFYVPNSKYISYRPNIEKRIDNLWDTKKTRFVYISRIMKAKGVDLLLMSLKDLNSIFLSNLIEVDFYGVIDINYKNEFLNTIEEIPNATYKGILNLEDNNGYDTLSSYHCMVFPTHHPSEGFAGVFIDAFIAGLPIITTKWNANTEIIKDEFNGLLINPNSQTELTAAMKRIIDKDVNIESLSRNAQLCSDKYDVNKVLNQDLLQQLNII